MGPIQMFSCQFWKMGLWEFAVVKKKNPDEMRKRQFPLFDPWLISCGIGIQLVLQLNSNRRVPAKKKDFRYDRCGIIQRTGGLESGSEPHRLRANVQSIFLG